MVVSPIENNIAIMIRYNLRPAYGCIINLIKITRMTMSKITVNLCSLQLTEFKTG